MDSYSELTKFLNELKDYKEILTNTQSKLLNSLVQEKRKGFPILPAKSDETLKKEIVEGKREQLVSKHGVLKDEIARLVGRTDISQFSKTWNRALSPVFGIGENKDALSLCIDYTLEAVGRLDAERKAAEKARKESLLADLFEKPEKTTQKTEPDSSVDKAENSKYQKIWEWIDTHRILSILGALAAIATIFGLILAFLK